MAQNSGELSTSGRVSVETVRRESGDEVEDPDAYTEISAAVERKVDQRLKEAEARTELTIQQAVKRALDKRAEKSLAKKPKREPDFKKKGNKKRYDTNNELIAKIDEAIEDIDSGELQKAKEKLESGKETLRGQQKIIQLADREDHGWEVVKHYEADDLADDSSDEKAIKKARKEALASINKRKLDKRKKEYSGYKFRSKSGQYPRGFRRSRYEDTYRKTWGPSTEGYNNKARYDRKPTGPCYKCGKLGHLQSTCVVGAPYAR